MNNAVAVIIIIIITDCSSYRQIKKLQNQSNANCMHNMLINYLVFVYMGYDRISRVHV